MQKWINEASWDRGARLVIGLVLIALPLLGTVTGAVAVVAGVLGAILLVTGLVGVCPLYLPFNFHTNHK